MDTNCATGILSLSIELFSFAIHKQLSNGLQYPDFTAPRKKPFQMASKLGLLAPRKMDESRPSLDF